MNVWSLLSSVALGIVVGWVAKELMDLVKRKLAHSHDVEPGCHCFRTGGQLPPPPPIQDSSSVQEGPEHSALFAFSCVQSRTPNPKVQGFPTGNRFKIDPRLLQGGMSRAVGGHLDSLKAFS
jgi:hypothetical protein